MPNPHPEFNERKEEMWKLLFEKDYNGAATIAANMLQDTYAFDAIHVAGLCLTALGQVEEGYDWSCAALSLSKASVEWYNNAAVAFMNKKAYLHSMMFAENGAKEYPDDIRLRYLAALNLCYASKWEDAIVRLDDVIERDPTFSHAYMSKGFCLHKQGKYEEAVATYRSAYDTANEGDREQMINNEVCILMELGRNRDALKLLDTEYPDSDRFGTVYNRSFLLLGLGGWPEAWHMYRTRHTVRINNEDPHKQIPDQPIAQTLDDIKGKHLFYYHEQGLGDTINFIRYAKVLRPYCSHITLGVPTALRRLTDNFIMDGSFTVVSGEPEDDELVAKAEVALPTVDAPAILEQRIDNILAPIPYFQIPELEIRKHLLPATARPRIGLCWAGASRPENINAHAIDKRRSVSVEMMEPIFDFHDRVQLISLQQENHRLHDGRILEPVMNSYDVLDTMAIIKQLDLVITIDSAVCHMAGSIGKPVWMLSRLDGCWRWFYNEYTMSERTDWYPTMKIYRQKTAHSWPEVIDRVVRDLDASLKTGIYDPWSYEQAAD